MRSLDAVQAFDDELEGVEVKDVIMTGFSKRGATTWLTGIYDDRVRAMAPGVFDILYMDRQIQRHYDAYGFYAEAISDYVEQGVIERLDTPDERTSQKDLLNRLRDLLGELDDRDAAGRHYRVAHDIARELGHSDAPLYAINRGRVLLEAGKFEEARSRFVIALREAARLDAWLATVLARASLLPCAAHARHWSSWDTQWACLGPLRTGRYVHRDVAAAARLAARLADKAGQRERAKLARGLALDQYQRLGMTRMVHMVRADAPAGG